MELSSQLFAGLFSQRLLDELAGIAAPCPDVGLANQLLWLVLIVQRELWGLLPLTAWLALRNLTAMVEWRQHADLREAS